MSDSHRTIQISYEDSTATAEYLVLAERYIVDVLEFTAAQPPMRVKLRRMIAQAQRLERLFRGPQ